MFNKIKEYYVYCRDKRYDTLAGTLSFFFILSFIPLLYLSLHLYIWFGNILKIDTPLPQIIQDYISFDFNAGVSILFVLTTIYSASNLFLQIRRTGEIIYMVKKPAAPLKYKIVSCGIVLITMVVLACGFLCYAIAKNYLEDKLNSILLKVGAGTIIFLIMVCLLIIINQHATNKKLTKRQLKRGVIFTVVYITIVSLGFLVYLTFANYDYLYGVFSTIIIAFIYIYLMMRGVVAGIIINQKNYNRLS